MKRLAKTFLTVALATVSSCGVLHAQKQLASSLTISGTAGAGFVQIANQSVAPATPTSAGVFYFDSSNHLAWKNASGNIGVINLGGASRTITLSGNPTLADWFDQSVKTGASPTFATVTATLNGSAPAGSLSGSTLASTVTSAPGLAIPNINILAYGASTSASASANRVAIQAAIDAASTAGGGIVYIPNGTYTIGLTSHTSGGIVGLQMKSNVTLIGQSRDNAILKQEAASISGGTYHRLIMTDQAATVSNIVLRDFCVDGNSSAQPSNGNGGNIILATVSNGLIDGVKSINANGQGIQITNDTAAYGTNNTIRGCYVDTCQGIGIQSAQFDGLSIIGNTVRNTTDNGIDLYGEDGTTVCHGKNFIISDNRVYNASVGIFLETVRDGLTVGNVTVDCTFSGINVNRINGEPKNLLITGNHFIGKYTTDLLNTDSPYGARVSGDTSGVQFIGNEFINFKRAGILLGATSYVSTSNNVFRPYTQTSLTASTWVTGTAYALSDFVQDPGDSNNIYICILALTSSTQPHLDPTHWTLSPYAPIIQIGGSHASFMTFSGDIVNAVGSVAFPSSLLVQNAAVTSTIVRPMEFLGVQSVIGYDLNRATGNITALTASTLNGYTAPNQALTTTSSVAFGSAAAGTAGLTVSNTAVNATPKVASFLAPSATTGTNQQGPFIAIGVAESTRNSAVIQFSNAGSGSTSNAMGLGLYGGSVLFVNGDGTVNTTGKLSSTSSGAGTPGFATTNTAANSTPLVASHLAPNLTTGTSTQGAFMTLGAAESTRNCGIFMFNNAGAGSTSNSLSLGLYGSNSLYVYSTGVKVASAGTLIDLIVAATATLDFGSISAGASADLTITVTGAAVGDKVAPGLPSSPAAGIVFNYFVSAADTVTVRATNVTGSPVDPASASYSVEVFSN